MLVRYLLVSVAVAGCSRSGDMVRPEPEPTIGSVVDTMLAAVQMSEEEMRTARRRGTTVDTIMVHPSEIQLRVGEHVILFDALTLKALDINGEPVVDYRPTFIYGRHRATRRPRGSIATVAIAPGVDTVFVEALPRNPSDPRPRPSTLLLIRVAP